MPSISNLDLGFRSFYESFYEDVPMALTALPKETLLEIGGQLVRAAAAADAVFTLDGTPTITVALDNGSYRKVMGFAGWEFFLRSVYMGKREGMIFVFEPVDDKEFQFMEVPEREIDAFLPLMPSTIAQAMGWKLESMAELIDIVHCQMQIEAAALEAEAEAIAQSDPNWGAF